MSQRIYNERSIELYITEMLVDSGAIARAVDVGPRALDDVGWTLRFDMT